MEVVSTSPLRVASTVWQPRAGAWALTVVCKATFRLEPGVSPLAGAQDAPVEDDAPWDDPAGSLRAPGDLVPFKARAEVLLVGHAFAPAGQTARVLPARLQAGAVDKRVDVWCDRIFWHEGRLLEGQPFSRMPLRWERAAGGPGTANPVGLRFDAPPDARGAVPVPNLQPPGIQIARRGDTFAPIGFGPLAPAWPGRAAKLREHATGWVHRAFRERPVPAGLDRAYFNAAPPDQQIAAIEPDERLVLEHLHPEHTRLETQLPGVRPVARMTAGGRAGEDIVLVADTLWIDTDRGLACLVWRGRVPLVHAAEEGCITVSASDAGAERAGATVMLGENEVRGAVMPFGGTQAWSGKAASAPMATILGGREGAPALPFGPAKSPWLVFKAEPASGVEKPEPADTGTVFGVKGRAHGVLPMTWDAPEPERPAPIAELEIDDEETSPALEVAVPAEVPLPAEPEAASPEVPIERYAAIAASIARRRADTAAILDAEGLSAAAWSALGARWKQAIREQTELGEVTLMRAYAAAYVARLEEERGPISVAEYARLVVAAERSRLTQALTEMTLPRGSMMLIERVWLERLAANTDELGAGVREAVRAARRHRGDEDRARSERR